MALRTIRQWSVLNTRVQVFSSFSTWHTSLNGLSSRTLSFRQYSDSMSEGNYIRRKIRKSIHVIPLHYCTSSPRIPHWEGEREGGREGERERERVSEKLQHKIDISLKVSYISAFKEVSSFEKRNISYVLLVNGLILVKHGTMEKCKSKSIK